MTSPVLTVGWSVCLGVGGGGGEVRPTLQNLQFFLYSRFILPILRWLSALMAFGFLWSASAGPRPRANTHCSSSPAVYSAH